MPLLSVTLKKAEKNINITFLFKWQLDSSIFIPYIISIKQMKVQ